MTYTATYQWWAVRYDEWLEKADLILTSMCVCRAVEIDLIQITFISGSHLLNGSPLLSVSILYKLVILVVKRSVESKQTSNICGVFIAYAQNMCT